MQKVELIIYMIQQIDLNETENSCVYNDDGTVKQYEKLSFSDLEENVRTSQDENRNRRPSRKDIVEFLLELIDE